MDKSLHRDFNPLTLALSRRERDFGKLLDLHILLETA
jgi:hypothetical protein